MRKAWLVKIVDYSEFGKVLASCITLTKEKADEVGYRTLEHAVRAADEMYSSSIRLEIESFELYE